MVKRKIPDVISEKELIELVTHPSLKRKKRRIAYLFMFYQALRISEVIKLRKEDYDKYTKLLHIRQAKGSKDRKIPISPNLVKAIKYLPFGSEKAKDGGIRALQIALKRDGRRILNKDLHPHTLRHSGATYYLNVKGWSTRQVQVFLGHSRVSTTEIYTHVNPKDLVNVMWKDII